MMKEKVQKTLLSLREKRRVLFHLGILSSLFFFLYEIAPFLKTEILGQSETINGYQLLSFFPAQGDALYYCSAMTILILILSSVLFLLSLIALFLPEKTLTRVPLSLFVLLFLKLAFDITRVVLFATIESNIQIASCGYLLTPLDALLFFLALAIHVNFHDKKDLLFAKKEKTEEK